MHLIREHQINKAKVDKTANRNILNYNYSSYKQTEKQKQNLQSFQQMQKKHLEKPISTPIISLRKFRIEWIFLN